MIHRLAVVLVALGTTAFAQDARFGIQGSLNLPQGDLGKKEVLDNQLGLGFGLHGIFSFQGGHALRPRVDYILYGSNDRTTADTAGGTSYSAKSSLKLRTLSFGVDYLYFLKRQDQGLYLTVGLSHNAQKLEGETVITISGPGGTNVYTGGGDETYNKIGFAAGLGHQFNKSFGAELRYTLTQFGDDDWTNNNLQLAATWRF